MRNRVAKNKPRPAATKGAPDEIQIELPKALAKRLNRLSRVSGRSVDSLVGECVDVWHGAVKDELARNGGAR